MRTNTLKISVVALCVAMMLSARGHAADPGKADVEAVVAHAIRPVMERYGIPGMAVGIIVHGQSYTFDYGLASKATGRPVTHDTLFEIGSISKTFTATLAAYAQVRGHLSLSGSASQYLPALRGSSFDKVSLLNLGTYTSGGLPLQVPDEVTNDDQLMRYFRNWKPSYGPGSYRIYSNPSIGMLGMIAATSMHEDFSLLIKRTLFMALGMNHAYLDVPQAELANYAQGYTKTDAPIRMAPGVLAAEAYGVKTTAADMVRFVEANMGMIRLDNDLRRAIIDTHTGYYTIGPMTQDLVWEQYRYPAELPDLLAGNAAGMAYEAHPAARLDPPSPPQDDVVINKTGSTNGFAAYVAFIPAKQTGIVLLANKDYPIDAQVTAAYGVLTRLGSHASRP